MFDSMIEFNKFVNNMYSLHTTTLFIALFAILIVSIIYTVKINGKNINNTFYWSILLNNMFILLYIVCVLFYVINNLDDYIVMNLLFIIIFLGMSILILSVDGINTNNLQPTPVPTYKNLDDPFVKHKNTESPQKENTIIPDNSAINSLKNISIAEIVICSIYIGFLGYAYYKFRKNDNKE